MENRNLFSFHWEETELLNPKLCHLRCVEAFRWAGCGLLSSNSFSFWCLKVSPNPLVCSKQYIQIKSTLYISQYKKKYLYISFEHPFFNWRLQRLCCRWEYRVSKPLQWPKGKGRVTKILFWQKFLNDIFNERKLVLGLVHVGDYVCMYLGHTKSFKIVWSW